MNNFALSRMYAIISANGMVKTSYLFYSIVKKLFNMTNIANLLKGEKKTASASHVPIAISKWSWTRILKSYTLYKIGL
jgi:hypothetical protein